MYGISRSIIKVLPSYMNDKIIAHFNGLLRGDIDPKLCVGKSVFCFKDKGDEQDIKNYRRITSLPNITNCLHRIINTRIATYLKNNNYFDTTVQKAGLSAASHGVFEQIYKVRSVIKDANQNKQPCAVLFLDIKSAFDNIDRDAVFKVMEYYGVEENVISYLRRFYDNLAYFIAGSKKIGELRNWGDGLVQGCSTSPLLFTMCINYILTYINKTSFTKNGYKFKENGEGVLTLAYMDDIAITCNNFESLNEVFNDLKENLESFGLELSVSKCAMMIINEEIDDLKDLKSIPIVTQATYLGTVISSNGEYKQDYKLLVKEINGRLEEFKNISPEKREERFKKILPTIKRSMLRLYDAEGEDMGMLIAIIEQNLKHLGISVEGLDLDISNTIDYVLVNTDDAVIKNIPEKINIVKNSTPVKPTKIDLDDLKTSYQTFKKDLDIDGQ